MYILVNHNIVNPEKFWEILSSNPTMPEGFGVKAMLPGKDASKAVCIWQAPNQTALEKLINDTVGDFCNNSYMEINENNMFGL